jgi:hypothetical protein
VSREVDFSVQLEGFWGVDESTADARMESLDFFQPRLHPECTFTMRRRILSPILQSRRAPLVHANSDKDFAKEGEDARDVVEARDNSGFARWLREDSVEGDVFIVDFCREMKGAVFVSEADGAAKEESHGFIGYHLKSALGLSEKTKNVPPNNNQKALFRTSRSIGSRPS